MIVKNMVKEFAKEQNLRLSDDTTHELEKEITRILLKACERAKSNGRSTLMPKDV